MQLLLGKYAFKLGTPIPGNDKDRVGLHPFFFFLQLGRNVLNNMDQLMDALNFHIEMIVEEQQSTFIF